MKKHLHNQKELFYYYRLDAREREAYREIKEGFLHFAKEIHLQVSVQEVGKIHQAVCQDQPEFFYAADAEIRYDDRLPGECWFLPQYSDTAERVLYYLQSMEEKIRPLVLRLQEKSDLEKEKEIHDFLLEQVTYGRRSSPRSHEIDGVLLDGIGVCDGISKAFQYIADRVGLRAMVIYGETDCEEEEKGHAWNGAQVDGNWYHLDVTFDLTLSKRLKRYDYFNLSDEEIREDHLFTEGPICTESMAVCREELQYAELKKGLKRFLDSAFGRQKQKRKEHVYE